MKIKYFAYGSNMNSKRMIERGVNFNKFELGILNGYKLIINKKSYKDPTFGFANIIKNENSIVEGVLYEINSEDIKKLDKFEGYPNHYLKDIVYVNGYKSVVYIANPNWENNTPLKITEEYKNHLLESKSIVSEKYYNDILKKL